MRCDRPAGAPRDGLPAPAAAAAPALQKLRRVLCSLSLQGVPTGAQETVAVSSSLSLIKVRLRHVPPGPCCCTLLLQAPAAASRTSLLPSPAKPMACCLPILEIVA